MVKNLTANAGDMGLIPVSGRSPTPVLFSEESHELSSLAAYSPWCCKGSEMAEAPECTCTHTHTHTDTHPSREKLGGLGLSLRKPQHIVAM